MTPPSRGFTPSIKPGAIHNTWGRTIYTNPAGANINDQLRRDGLEYQWFATINAALLAALHATPAN